MCIISQMAVNPLAELTGDKQSSFWAYSSFQSLHERPWKTEAAVLKSVFLLNLLHFSGEKAFACCFVAATVNLTVCSLTFLAFIRVS